MGVLPEEVARPLVGIARLRNQFAHNIDYKLTEADIETLAKRLTAQQRLDWETFYKLSVEDKSHLDAIAHKFRCYILCVRVWLEELYDPVVLGDE